MDMEDRKVAFLKLNKEHIVRQILIPCFPTFVWFDGKYLPFPVYDGQLTSSGNFDLYFTFVNTACIVVAS